MKKLRLDYWVPSFSGGDKKLRKNGNRKMSKKRVEKKNSNNINKLGVSENKVHMSTSYSEIPIMRCNIDQQMTCTILVSILDLWTSLPQCLRVSLFHSVSMSLLPGSIFRVCVTDTISAEYGHAWLKLLKNYAKNSSKCHQNSRSVKWRPLKLETFICQIW